VLQLLDADGEPGQRPTPVCVVHHAVHRGGDSGRWYAVTSTGGPTRRLGGTGPKQRHSWGQRTHASS
ncbi:hypothetical protein SARC_14542, partial [Sphaeroforma arctica JP610]